MERQFRVSFVITDEGLVSEQEAIDTIKDVVHAHLTNPNVNAFEAHELTDLYVGRMHNQIFCTPCSLGDCYGHTHEFLNRDNKVTKCGCPNFGNLHGKLRPRQPRTP